MFERELYSYPSNITISLTRLTVIIECHYHHRMLRSNTGTLQREQETMQLVDMLHHARDVASKEDKSLEPSMVIKISNSFFNSLLREAGEKLRRLDASIERHSDDVTTRRETGTIRVVRVEFLRMSLTTLTLIHSNTTIGTTSGEDKNEIRRRRVDRFGTWCSNTTY